MIKDKFFLKEIDEICKRVKFTKLRNRNILILGSNSFFGSYLTLVFAYANIKYKTNCKIM